MKKIIYIALSCFLIYACKSDPKSSLKELNLLKYGFPITILAPDSATVKKEDWIVSQALTVKKDKNFSLQIWSSTPPTANNVAKILADQKAKVSKKENFSAFVQEDENGFIFESTFDSTRHNYDFRYIRLMGENEFIFQTGMIGLFSKEDVELMYNAVQKK